MSDLHRGISSSVKLWIAVAAMGCAIALTGCGATNGTLSRGLTGDTVDGIQLRGYIHGGQQPIIGAVIQLYAAGTGGYGSAATPLLSSTVVTDQNGGFTIPAGYSCPSGGQLYITAAGGNSGSGTSNSAIALMAALGSCTSLSSTSFINVNEVTTVAAVWALQQFGSTTGSALAANATTASDNFGSTASNVQGLANAMGIANVLASVATGTSPGANSSNNQWNVEYWHINTLADILASCVNSSSSCSTLFSYTGAATDTLQAALYMARNPTLNVSGLAGLVGSTPPFTPTDTTTNDLTIGLSYKTGTSATRWIAIDQYGNAWITTSGASVYELDPTGNIITTPTSYTLNGTSTAIKASYEVAVDTQNNAWFTDETAYNVFEVKGSSSAGGANGGAGQATATGITQLLEGIVVDGKNNVWFSTNTGGLGGLLNGAYGTVVAGGPTTSNPFGLVADLSNSPSSPNYTASNGGSFLYAINSGGCSGNSAVEMGGATSATAGSMAMAYTTGSGTVSAGAKTALNYIVDAACSNTMNIANNTPSGATPYVMMSLPYGIAVDNSNNLWIVNQNYVTTTDKTSAQFSLTKLTPNYSAGLTPSTANFSFVNYSGGGLATPYYLAMDGASAAWVANSTGLSSGVPMGTVSAISNNGTALSPSTGFYGGTYVNGTVTNKRTIVGARGIAVDGSGNVWVSSTSTFTPSGGTATGLVTLMVGAATPTVTPLSLGIANGTLASKP